VSEPGPYFELRDEVFVPRPHARNPWSDTMLHGRLLAGLAARQVGQAYEDDRFRVARLTVDMFRAPPMEPVSVVSRLIRDGRRVRVAEVQLSAGAVTFCHVSALILARGVSPGGAIWSPPPWSVPAPGALAGPAPDMRSGTEVRTISGDHTAAEPHRAWLLDTCPLVAGEELTSLVRAMIAADFASPFALAGETGLEYINADITLYLGRAPRGEWIGLQSGGHVADSGIGLGLCAMYDIEGPVGYVAAAALANGRIRG
jgi:Thioesterase-like superfamily